MPRRTKKESDRAKPIVTKKQLFAAANSVRVVTDPNGTRKPRIDPNFPADLTKYELGAARTASGRRTQDIGDAVAIALRGLTAAEVLHVTARVIPRATAAALEEQYGHLTAARIRTACGNRIRGYLRRTGQKLELKDNGTPTVDSAPSE